MSLQENTDRQLNEVRKITHEMFNKKREIIRKNQIEPSFDKNPFPGLKRATTHRFSHGLLLCVSEDRKRAPVVSLFSFL